MTCIRIPNGIVTLTDTFRLRLSDGRHVFMDWHEWYGPTFWHDRSGCREIDYWYENQLIVDALNWFIGRGNRA